jgi:hypothetical protein
MSQHTTSTTTTTAAAIMIIIIIIEIYFLKNLQNIRKPMDAISIAS